MSGTKRLIALLTAVLGMTLAASVAMTGSAQAAPYSHHMTCSVSSSNPPPGGTVTIHCTGAHPNVTLTIFLHPKNTVLGTVTTDSSGSATTTVTLPAGETGHHVLLIRQPQGNTVAIPIDIGGRATAAFSAHRLGSDPPAATGVAIVGLGSLGLVLLVGGGLMLLAGRRRRSSA